MDPAKRDIDTAYSTQNVAVPVMLRRSGLLLPTRRWNPYRRNIIFCVHRDFRKAIRPLFSFHGRLGPGLVVSQRATALAFISRLISA